ncbi:MAG: selenocysteine-specific translation elongation factor, partial [Acidobacteriota bacterium]
MHPVVIGTAGHIDHGKTQLVRALTGIDCDRLKEEKERGITTDIGFGYLDYPDGVRLAFIDVPGHERFVHNMLAGACGIDVVLLVVAADESIKPQTREHAEICRLLGIRRGVIALSKADLVDAETLEVVRLEVQEFAAGGFLPQAQVVPVSARTQQGLEELKAELRRAAESAPVRDASRPVRLPVDRVFSARGFGTVVTGTLWSGRLRSEQEVEIVPGGRRARVRGLQVHHQAVGEALAGQRAAVNLQGLNLDAMTRGAVIMEPGAFQPAKVLLAWLELVPEIGQRKRPTPLGLHHGTLETTVRWRWLREPTCGKGVVSGLAALYCQQAVVAVRGDHFVLRRRSPAATIGGGEVLDTLSRARKPAAMAEHAGRLRGAGAQEALLEDLRWAREPAVEEHRLWISSGVERKSFETALARAREQGRVVQVGRSLWAQRTRLEDLERRALELVGSFHERDRLQAGMPLEEFKRRLLAGAPRELV